MKKQTCSFRIYKNNAFHKCRNKVYARKITQPNVLRCKTHYLDLPDYSRCGIDREDYEVLNELA